MKDEMDSLLEKQIWELMELQVGKKFYITSGYTGED